LVSAASDEKIEARMQELRELSKEYAKAKAQQVYLEEFKKSKLAILMKAAEVAGHKSATTQEREARASDSYIEFLDGLKDAVERAESLRWQLQIAEIGSEVWRTQQANQRAERRGYGA
jgi:hypothetical protein